MRHLLFLIVALAIFNRLRGTSFVGNWKFSNPGAPLALCPHWRITLDNLTDKTESCIYMGISVAYIAWPQYDLWAPSLGLIVALGVRFWAIFPWGPYCAAFDGLPKVNDPGDPWIDAVIYTLIPRSKNTPAWNRLRGTIGMALRGLYLAPAFLALNFAQHLLAAGIGSPTDLLPAVKSYRPDTVTFVLMACTLLQGPTYGAMRWLPGYSTRGVPVAECLWGAIMGVMFYTALNPA